MPIGLANSSCVFDVSRSLLVDKDGLSATIEAHAQLFRQHGARHGDRIIICHQDDLIFLIDLFACWRVGATAAPLSPSLVDEEKNELLARIEPAIWIGDIDHHDIAVLEPRLLKGDVATGERPAPCPGPENTDAVALILTTSGTTGKPKCVQLTHSALQERLRLNTTHIGGATMARSLLTLPLHFGHGLIGNALTPLSAGGCLVVGTHWSVDNMAVLGGLIDSHRVSFLTSVPSFWRMVLRLSQPPSANTLQRIQVG
jgi:acyl-CoA synthetase (AMP-forming)/AMP-acid ligase II